MREIGEQEFQRRSSQERIQQKQKKSIQGFDSENKAMDGERKIDSFTHSLTNSNNDRFEDHCTKSF